MLPDPLSDLKRAVTAMHGCACSHSHTAHVHEMIGVRTVWSGDVEVFTLKGHAKTDTAFAWAWKDGNGETHYIAVLSVPPVTTPHAAVQNAIANGKHR